MNLLKIKLRVFLVLILLTNCKAKKVDVKNLNWTFNKDVIIYRFLYNHEFISNDNESIFDLVNQSEKYFIVDTSSQLLIDIFIVEKNNWLSNVQKKPNFSVKKYRINSKGLVQNGNPNDDYLHMINLFFGLPSQKLNYQPFNHLALNSIKFKDKSEEFKTKEITKKLTEISLEIKSTFLNSKTKEIITLDLDSKGLLEIDTIIKWSSFSGEMTLEAREMIKRYKFGLIEVKSKNKIDELLRLTEWRSTIK